MPINAFGGGPGSGKTYGVMEHVILPAVAKGRFVVTNIDGLDPEAIYEYVANNAPRGKIVCIGHIRSCDRSAPDQEDFFPGEEALDKPMTVPDAEYGRVWGGDLVVIDEATRYWSQGDKVKRSHAYFFREHRHFTNEFGHSCDLVVVDPDLAMLARALKGKVEMSSVTHKPKAIGLNRYSVNLYRGVKLTGKPISTGGPFAFKKEIYSLYKSYSHAQAKEQPIDRRQNVLLNRGLWAYAAATVLLFGGGIFFAYRFFAHKAKPAESKPSVSVDVPRGDSGVSALGAVPAPSVAKPSDFSDAWRVLGRYESGGLSYVVLADSDGRMRVDSPSAYNGVGAATVGRVDGQRVAMWSGSKSSSGLVPASVGRSK